MPSDLPIGTILIYSLTTLPDGYLLCNGDSYSTTDYSSLYAVIETTYGSDDDTTFNVPDFKLNFPIGKTSSQSLGKKAGSTSVSISDTNLPSHTHTIDILFTHYHDVSYNQTISSQQQYLNVEFTGLKSGRQQGQADRLYGSSNYDTTSQDGISLNSNNTTISISEKLDSSGNSISLDVKNSQMNLNYIIKYA